MLVFGKLSDLIENVELLEMEEALQSVFKQEIAKQEVIRLNTEEQLFTEGVDANNTLLSSIGGSYSPTTLRLKSRPDVSPSRIDLFDTGQFYNSFYVESNFDHLVISANTIKQGEDLQKRWGNFIIGLNEESLEKLVKFISRLVQKETEKIIC